MFILNVFFNLSTHLFKINIDIVDRLRDNAHMKENIELEKAINLAGGQSALARLVGVSPQLVHSWKRFGVPPHRAVQIEAATGGKVKRGELRPDIFGAKPKMPVGRVSARTA